VIYSNKKERDKAICWLKQACDKGDTETKKAAAINLGNQYAEKSHSDYQEAIKRYDKYLVKARSLFQTVVDKSNPNLKANKIAKEALLALDRNSE
jgi:tetratricopeptide (TPR) repeat protein